MWVPKNINVISSRAELETTSCTTTLPPELQAYFNANGEYITKQNENTIYFSNGLKYYPPVDCNYFDAKDNQTRTISSSQTIVYHGCSFQTLKKIMETNQEIIKMPSTAAHIDTDCVWFSPSCLYSGHPLYAVPTSSGRRYVLQIAVNKHIACPGQGGEYGVTIDYDTKYHLDNRISNEQIAWYSNENISNSIIGLLVFTNKWEDTLSKKKIKNHPSVPSPFPYNGPKIYYVHGSNTHYTKCWKGLRLYSKYNCTVIDDYSKAKDPHALVVASSSGATTITTKVQCNLLLLSPVFIPECSKKTIIIFAKNDAICQSCKLYCSRNNITFKEVDDNHGLSNFTLANNLIVEVDKLLK